MRKAFLAALVSVVLWAAAFVGIRAAGRAFSPGPLALGRLALGSVLLGALVLSRPKVRPTRRELALLVLAGLLWFGVYQVVLNEAERRVDAGTAAMLVLIAPIFIVALAAAFLKERTTPNLLVGGSRHRRAALRSWGSCSVCWRRCPLPSGWLRRSRC